jgi:hypothetical protein
MRGIRNGGQPLRGSAPDWGLGEHYEVFTVKRTLLRVVTKGFVLTLFWGGGGLLRMLRKCLVRVFGKHFEKIVNFTS